MQWTKPDFQEITLGMEVTAYVNTDESVLGGEWSAVRKEVAAPAVNGTNERQPVTNDQSR
jgi:coenzyme PQQ precursor peptide PqqA